MSDRTYGAIIVVVWFAVVALLIWVGETKVWCETMP